LLAPLDAPTNAKARATTAFVVMGNVERKNKSEQTRKKHDSVANHFGSVVVSSSRVAQHAR
jgi:hypothetical protein